MKNIPENIWLNLGEEVPDDADFHDLSEVTWSGNKEFDKDVEYVRNAGWISVKDRLPDDDRLVLVHCAGIQSEICHCTAYYKFGAWQFPDDWYYNSKVTHWMEIPVISQFNDKDNEHDKETD